MAFPAGYPISRRCRPVSRRGGTAGSFSSASISALRNSQLSSLPWLPRQSTRWSSSSSSKCSRPMNLRSLAFRICWTWMKSIW